MAASAVYCIEDFLSSESKQSVDDTITEVFNLMFGFEVDTAEGNPVTAEDGDNPVTGLIGLSGAMRGSFEIRMSIKGAVSVASAMLGGLPVQEEDDSVTDAVGELCNMVAAGWKNRSPLLAANCSVSLPSVISGVKYQVKRSTPSVQLTRCYKFDKYGLQLALFCEDRSAA